MTRLVRLTALGPWHLGARGVGMEGSETYVGADTLFSALCHAWRHLYGEVEALLQPFLEGTPPFRLSSAFPCDAEAWYPARPLLDGQALGDRKTLKKVRYAHQTAWSQWVAGQPLREDEWTVEGPFLLRKGCQPPLKVETMPHVSLDRHTSASNLYFTGEVHFRQGCGMALLVHSEAPEWHARVLALLEWLGDHGVGGERTSGRGQFRVSEHEAPLEFGAGERMVLLSPYAVAGAQELAAWNLAASAYWLALRRGFMEAHGAGGLRRKSVRVFAEGSVLQRSPSAGVPAGTLADVTPEAFDRHRVYRYGLPFTVVCHA